MWFSPFLLAVRHLEGNRISFDMSRQYNTWRARQGLHTIVESSSETMNNNDIFLIFNKPRRDNMSYTIYRVCINNLNIMPNKQTCSSSSSSNSSTLSRELHHRPVRLLYNIFFTSCCIYTEEREDWGHAILESDLADQFKLSRRRSLFPISRRRTSGRPPSVMFTIAPFALSLVFFFSFFHSIELTRKETRL